MDIEGKVRLGGGHEGELDMGGRGKCGGGKGEHWVTGQGQGSHGGNQDLDTGGTAPGIDSGS